ncbi:MAG TPA: hypothetical protein VFP23_03215 [Solirubrobacterales bacterium]|nr:hypothetical protein [Solirubrobacterales bacterium]
MQTDRLKSMVQDGRYRPQPALVAEAMLRRRGVRELLVGTVTPFTPADRSLRPAASRRQAA